MKISSGKKRRSSRYNKSVSTAKKLKNRRLAALGVGGTMALFASIATVGLFSSAGSSYGNTPYLICLASGGTPTSCANIVPEISALEGTAALAVIAAMLLLAWERRRQA